jgi:hypothetical protein
MSAAAIMLATQALAGRLREALINAGQPGTVFIGPLDDSDARSAALILMLYRLVPSASLRNSEHRVARRGADTPLVYTNALPLDLYFLLTVGNSAGGDDQLLRVLGTAIQALNASPHLAGAEVAQDPVHISMEPLSTEEISRIWALFPTVNYRTSVAYLATPVWVDPLEPPTARKEVLQDAPRVGQTARGEHA